MVGRGEIGKSGGGGGARAGGARAGGARAEGARAAGGEGEGGGARWAREKGELDEIDEIEDPADDEEEKEEEESRPGWRKRRRVFTNPEGMLVEELVWEPEAAHSDKQQSKPPAGSGTGKTLPLPCVSMHFAANTLPLPRVSTVFHGQDTFLAVLLRWHTRRVCATSAGEATAGHPAARLAWVPRAGTDQPSERCVLIWSFDSTPFSASPPLRLPAAASPPLGLSASRPLHLSTSPLSVLSVCSVPCACSHFRSALPAADPDNFDPDLTMEADPCVRNSFSSFSAFRCAFTVPIGSFSAFLVRWRHAVPVAGSLTTATRASARTRSAAEYN